ncbi:MAG TPA: RNA polymerase subunit sigma-24 [Armatimonadetes bacterium]|nr:RNA polymerase subunit sigma-24 [Armatimonadota bacterium]
MRDSTGEPPQGGPDPSDEVLVARVRLGDQSAFDMLIERFQTKVYNLAFRQLENAEDAADLTQEAFMRIYRGLDSFQGGSTLSTWIYRVVHNLCLDEIKKRRRRPQIVRDPSDPDEGGDSLVERLGDGGETPEEGVLADERRLAVHAAVARLRRHHREVIQLYDLDGYSYNEVAEILDTNVGTIKSRLNRARIALVKELEKDRHLFFE